jgi:hypothetical protein
MSDVAGLRQALEVLDARVQAIEALMARELHLRDELRSRQTAITQQERALASSLNEMAASDPASFRVHELRIKRLSEDQRQLQPSLAKAAIQRQNVQDVLKSLLRQRLGLQIQIEKMSETKKVFQTEQERQHALFEMQKRR